MLIRCYGSIGTDHTGDVYPQWRFVLVEWQISADPNFL